MNKSATGFGLDISTLETADRALDQALADVAASSARVARRLRDFTDTADQVVTSSTGRTPVEGARKRVVSSLIDWPGGGDTVRPLFWGARW